MRLQVGSRRNGRSPLHHFHTEAAVARGGAQRKIERSRNPRPTPRAPQPAGKAPLMGKTLDRRGPDTSDINPAWKLHDAFETYGVKNWGKGYFGISKQGHVTVHPDKDPERAIDLKDLVDQIRTRGIQPPLLLRFTDILRHRIGEIAAAFDKSRTEYGYTGEYH